MILMVMVMATAVGCKGVRLVLVLLRVNVRVQFVSNTIDRCEAGHPGK